jgi:hypothetical protein
MLARRVCCRDPLPRRLDRICGRGPTLALGQESAPAEARSGFWKGERASEVRGCFERGTLNADRKANRKGATLFNGLSSWRGCKSQLRILEVFTQKLEGRMTRGRSNDAIARPISSPSPRSSGCTQLAWKCWDRGRGSRLQGPVQSGPRSCHWHTRRHRMLYRQRRAGPGS